MLTEQAGPASSRLVCTVLPTCTETRERVLTLPSGQEGMGLGVDS